MDVPLVPSKKLEEVALDPDTLELIDGINGLSTA